MPVTFEEEEIKPSRGKVEPRPLFAGAKFGYSKPRMMKFLLNMGVVKHEDTAVDFLVAIAVIFFVASLLIFLWAINAI